MNIVFLADSDEPGMSGVGDYSLRLCEALHRFNIKAVTLPVGPPDSFHRNNLVERVSALRPDWVSFQFVPYAFAHRGCVSPRTLPWKGLRGRIGTHIMFHEIWIGSHQGASLQDRLMGAIQRRGILKVCHELTPDRVHCSNRLYSAILERAGVPNKLLPLFGNIPVTSCASDPYVNVTTGIKPGTHRSDWVVAALFGSIYPSENLLAVVRWLQDRSLLQRKRLLLVSLGDSPMAESTFNSLAQHFPLAEGPSFLVKGRLDSTDLSSWIRFTDCALATTPFNIIEKSGSALAFAEHGVPVIVMDAGADVRSLTLPIQDLSPEFWLFRDERLDALHGLPPRREPHPRLELVAQQFLADLQSS